MQANKRYLFYADTPYQVFNSIAMAEVEKKRGTTSDILVYAQFYNADSIAERLRQTDTFNRVFYVEPTRPKTSLGARMRVVSVHYGIHCISHFNIDENYDVFAYACPSSQVVDIIHRLRAKNPQLETIAYEDGSGSYTGNVFRLVEYCGSKPRSVVEDSVSQLRGKRFIKHLPFHDDCFRTETLYLHRPELCSYSPEMSLGFINVDSDAIDNSRIVFDCPANCNPDNTRPSVVVFDCYRSERVTHATVAIDKLLQLLEAKKIRYYLRPHPRSTVNPRIGGYGVLQTAFWEILCSDIVDNDTVLIGHSTSALLTPNIIYRKHPRLVFLCMLEDCPVDAQVDRSLEVLELARWLYNEEQEAEILTPMTIGDLDRFLENRIKNSSEV